MSMLHESRLFNPFDLFVVVAGLSEDALVSNLQRHERGVERW